MSLGASTSNNEDIAIFKKQKTKFSNAKENTHNLNKKFGVFSPSRDSNLLASERSITRRSQLMAVRK